MTKHVATKLRYEPGTKTLRADPENYCIAQSASWRDTGADMDGAVDYPSSMTRIVACVNACAGIPTEALEAGGDFIHAYLAGDTAAARDALAALQDIATRDD